MTDFSKTEMDEMMRAMSQQTLSKEETSKIPLLPPGAYGNPTRVSFSPLDGEKLSPTQGISEQELERLQPLKATLEVIFGKTRLSLRELAALEAGTLLPLNDLCDQSVEIHINGTLVGQGEIVAVDGKFGVRILSFTKN